MKLQQLRYIDSIATYGSMNEAAAQLYVSQPSLSAAVKDVEEEFGVTIFARTNKGVSLTPDGTEFLGYARQVLDQVGLMEHRYSGDTPSHRALSISTQHFMFAVSAFSKLVSNYDRDTYEFTLREAQTQEIIEDVRTLRSEIGLLQISDYNKQVLNKVFRDSGLTYTPLFDVTPHVFCSSKHPLSGHEHVTLEDLEPYPYLSFEQGAHQSFYYSEEPFATIKRDKNIKVTDRATLFNLTELISAYTIGTGFIGREISSTDAISIPIAVDDIMQIGYISHKGLGLSDLACEYLSFLNEYMGKSSKNELLNQ